MKLEDIFTTQELADIHAGTYDIDHPVFAAKLNLWAALEREECAKIAEDEWQNYSALNEAHQRLSPLPFNPNNFGIDMSIALMSKHIADLIRDRGNVANDFEIKEDKIHRDPPGKRAAKAIRTWRNK